MKNQPDQLPALPPELEARLDKALSMLPWNKAQQEIREVILTAIKAERARADALQADLARLSEAIRNTFSVPHSVLRRGENGRCSRSTCLCETEGLGAECVWLVPTDKELQRRTGEPHIDSYPLHSGLPTRADALEAALKELADAVQRDNELREQNILHGGITRRQIRSATDRLTAALAAARALLEKPQ